MTSFLSDETAAITVDWTVLTAALVGLGLATVATIRPGLQDTSTDIAEILSDMEIVTAFRRVISSNDFSDGPGDWVGGIVRDIPDFGAVLALSAEASTAELPIDIGTDHPFAMIEFDMILGDSWDGEDGSILLNGQEIVVGTHSWRVNDPDVRIIEGPAETTVTLMRATQNTGASSWTSGEDYTYRVQILAANDGTPLTLGAATNLNQRGTDEFFGIDNVQISGVNQG